MQTDDELLDYARQYGSTVLPRELQLHDGQSRDERWSTTSSGCTGSTGLRVIDASVMPAVTSTNTNAPTIMIAEKGAAMIREDARN